MTTIAFDGTSMAADSLTQDLGKTRYMTKVHKIENAYIFNKDILFGAAGDVRNIKLLYDWLLNVNSELDSREDPNFPSDKLDALLWDGEHLWNIDAAMVLLKIDTIPWAIGSGDMYSLGAMSKGANAEEAVSTAMTYDVGTGGLIKSLTLY